MFLVLGGVNRSYYGKELVNLHNLTHANFFWRIKDVLSFFRKEYDKHIKDRQQYNFREWLTVQSGNFVVFFLSPGQHPKQVDWLEIKAIVKDEEKA